jgi:hypothetical protein
MAVLVPTPVSRLRLFLAGLGAAALVWCRLQDVLFAIVIFAWVARYHFRRLGWFLPMPILLGAILLAYNYWYFGNSSGGYGLEKMAGPDLWAYYGGRLLDGMAGTLLSPGLGLFIFSSWTALALAAAPVAVPVWLTSRSIVWWQVWALVPFLLMLSKTTIWSAGFCFGPRYWTDVMPQFAVLLACGLAWAWWHRRRLLVAAFGIAVVLSMGIQVAGAFYYPCSWDEETDFNKEGEEEHLQHVWSWRDNRIIRGLRDGPFSARQARLAAAAPAAPPVYRPGTRIELSNASCLPYLPKGWYGPDPLAQWSGPKAEVWFTLQQKQPLRLRMSACTYHDQEVLVHFNGQNLGTLAVPANGFGVVELDLPANLLGDRNTLAFEMPMAKSPFSLGESEDRRDLGLAVEWIEFNPRP